MTNAVNNDFFDEWSVYDHVLNQNCMHHDEIYQDVRRSIAERYARQDFTVLDLGCGSARHLVQALRGRSIHRYIGYDLSDVALAHAAKNLAALGAPIELRQGDLLNGLNLETEQFDLIFSSFALHHLSAERKAVFFQSAYPRLRDTGMLLIIDTMRDDGEDRQVYLDRYCSWLSAECKTLSADALDLLFAHIRRNDFPETTALMAAIASDAGFHAPVEVSRVRWHHAWRFDRSPSRMRKAAILA